MKKLSAIIVAILCLSLYPAFAADSLPTAYLAVIRMGGNAVPPPNTPVEPMIKTICEIIPETIEGRNKIGEIWNKFAPKFDYKDWSYSHFDVPFYKAIIYYNGHILTFLSDSPELEERVADPELNKKKAAFNDLIQECKGWKPHAIP